MDGKRESGEYFENAAYEWSKDSVRLIVTVGSTAKAIFFYLQEVGYFKTNERYYTERANLDSFLVLYTVSGNGILEYGGKRYRIGAGQCFLIHCMEYHKYYNAPGCEWEFYWFHFNGGSALGYYRLYVQDGFRIQNRADGEYLAAAVRTLIDLNLHKDSVTEICSSDYIQRILTKLLAAGCMTGADTLYIPEYILKLKREIDRNFKSGLNLAHFEAALNRSRFRLAREFKKYIGLTINEYIIRTRLSYAKEQLKYGYGSVEQIAYESGFHNVTHFINLFKAREGRTPFQYRKEWSG